LQPSQLLCSSVRITAAGSAALTATTFKLVASTNARASKPGFGIRVRELALLF
jgi:hypothetical protein